MNRQPAVMFSARTRGAAARSAVAMLVWALPAICHAQGSRKASEESLLLGDIPSVFGASRFDQLITEAPASTSVITADDIATYGWRTLADVLRTVRGFYVTNDRSYSYVGTRGFSRPGDFNSRILLLLDGVRVNENIFDGGYIGMASLIDLSTVDRVEVIRGPSSSLYGTNALLGIVSVITAHGRARGGVRALAEMGSFGTRALSVITGHRTKSGIEFLGEATSRRVAGQDLYFEDFDSPRTSNGVAVGRDGERRDRLFAKAEWGSFALEGTINLHDKDVPTASFETAFNEGREVYRDNLHNLTLRYQPNGGPTSGLRGSLSLSRYDYNGEYPYATTSSSEWARGRWAVGDMQYTRLMGRHRLVIGGAYTANWRQEQAVIDEVGMPPVFFDTTTSAVGAVYALSESRVGQHLIFNGGLRYDHATGLDGSWNPRAALIYTLGRGSALKLLFGNAFRAPNNYERFYNNNGRTQKANSALAPERVTTLEAQIEKLINRHLKVTASVYRYRARQLIDVGIDPVDSLLQFNNLGRATGQGLELETEIDFGAISGRASYARQLTVNPDGNRELSNSPQHLGALTLSLPIAAQRARVGLELRGMSARLTPRGDELGGHMVANLTLSGRRFRGVEASASVTNVFDAAYSDPVGEEHVQRGIQQDGRALRVTVAYVF